TLTAGGASIALKGTGYTTTGQLTFSQTSIDLGAGGTMGFLITNTSGEATTGIVTAFMTGTDWRDNFTADFGSDCNGFDLGPGEPCTASVTFNPKSAGSKEMTIYVSANPGGLATMTVTGTGAATLPELVFSPMEHDFGNLTAPATSPYTLSVVNVG